MNVYNTTEFTLKEKTLDKIVEKEEDIVSLLKEKKYKIKVPLVERGQYTLFVEAVHGNNYLSMTVEHSINSADIVQRSKRTLTCKIEYKGQSKEAYMLEKLSTFMRVR